MSLGVKLDHIRGPGPPGDRMVRVTFRGKHDNYSVMDIRPLLCNHEVDVVINKCVYSIGNTQLVLQSQ